jgi:hypothetical protein
MLTGQQWNVCSFRYHCLNVSPLHWTVEFSETKCWEGQVARILLPLASSNFCRQLIYLSSGFYFIHYVLIRINYTTTALTSKTHQASSIGKYMLHIKVFNLVVLFAPTCTSDVSPLLIKVWDRVLNASLSAVSNTQHGSFIVSLRRSWDVPANAGVLCDKAAVIGDRIKGTLSLWFSSPPNF